MGQLLTMESSPILPALPHICRKPDTFRNLSPIRGELECYIIHTHMRNRNVRLESSEVH